MKPFPKGRCVSCKHWCGDREKALDMFKNNPVSMDQKRGWPNDGKCCIDDDFLFLDVDGDCCITVLYNANFGCIYWEE